MKFIYATFISGILLELLPEMCIELSYNLSDNFIFIKPLV